jgi:integrase
MRTVPLATSAVATLKAWRSNRLPVGPVFPVNIGTIDQSWQEARAEAGLDDVRFHTFDTAPRVISRYQVHR